jgi:3-hydroxyacyl-[acyl-carrier-protein] dehydratase
MKKNEEILSSLPYASPFLFVDELDHIDEEGATGSFYLDPQLDFYKGHFRDYPITPGVILIEIMAQIGLVGLGLYLMREAPGPKTGTFVLVATEIEFLKPVYPGETVRVKSKKIFFRFGKLKCEVSMYNEEGAVVCEGNISGMIKREHGNT